MVQIWKIKEH